LTINEGYLAIPEKYEKLIISLGTTQAKEYPLDKEIIFNKLKHQFH
jgi:hypothetical protein